MFLLVLLCFFFFFQAEDGIRDYKVTGVQTCALPIWDEFGPWTPLPHWHTISLSKLTLCGYHGFKYTTFVISSTLTCPSARTLLSWAKTRSVNRTSCMHFV